jgi:hypothetical protein
VELDDGSRVHAYKHVDTRSYFHLSENGRAFLYSAPGGYREIQPRAAIDEAFDGWERAPSEPAVRDEVRRALRRARATATRRQNRDAA